MSKVQHMPQFLLPCWFLWRWENIWKMSCWLPPAMKGICRIIMTSRHTPVKMHFSFCRFRTEITWNMSKASSLYSLYYFLQDYPLDRLELKMAMMLLNWLCWVSDRGLCRGGFILKISLEFLAAYPQQKYEICKMAMDVLLSAIALSTSLFWLFCCNDKLGTHFAPQIFCPR